MAVRTKGALSKWVRATLESRQGNLLSPLMFQLYWKRLWNHVECDDVRCANAQGRRIKDLRFVDDIYLLTETEGDLQKLTTKLYEIKKSYGIMINKEGAKVMAIIKDARADVTIAGQIIELVDKFKHLGSLITRDNDCSLEIERRIGIAANM